MILHLHDVNMYHLYFYSIYNPPCMFPEVELGCSPRVNPGHSPLVVPVDPQWKIHSNYPAW